MFLQLALGVSLLFGGNFYIDKSYKGFPDTKALFMEEWQCEQVKTDKEKCIKLDDEFYGLYDEEEE